MLTKEQSDLIAKILRVEPATFAAAIADTTEVPLTLTEGLASFTPGEITSRENTLKSANIRAGKEIAIKELKDSAGLAYDGEGSKDPARFLTEYQAKVKADSGVEDSVKVKELNDTISGLRNNLEKVTGEVSGFKQQAITAKNDSLLLSYSLEYKPGNLSNEEWLAVLKTNNELVEHEGVIGVKRGGEVVKDNLLKAIPAKDAITAYITERKIGKAAEANNGEGNKGRSGNDSKDFSGITNMKQFTAKMEAEGVHINSDKARAALTEVTKTNPNFDFATT